MSERVAAKYFIVGIAIKVCLDSDKIWVFMPSHNGNISMICHLQDAVVLGSLTDITGTTHQLFTSYILSFVKRTLRHAHDVIVSGCLSNEGALRELDLRPK